jgi:vancomycin resistance protein YoaR
VLNIRRAAEEIDGTILDPGETFSMNEALGERTTAKGYVPAPMISNGRLVDSVGGGISQLATTLYNAAFFAGFDLVEHSRTRSTSTGIPWAGRRPCPGAARS